MRVGTDPLLFNEDGNEAILYADSGANVYYGYSQQGTPLGTLTPGQSASVTDPIWVWSSSTTGSEVHVSPRALAADVVAGRVATRDDATGRLFKAQQTLAAANTGSFLRGQVPITGRLNGSGGSNGTITGITTHMNRYVFPVLCDAYDIRVVYSGANAFAAGANDIDIESWLETGPETAYGVGWSTSTDDNANAVQFMFQSEAKKTLKASARFLVSDPLPYVLRKGTHIAVHTRATVADVAKVVPSNRAGLASYGDAIATDATAVAVTTPAVFYGAQSSGAMFVPVAIIGTPVGEPPSAIIAPGDSICNATADNRSFATPEASVAYFERAMATLALPHVNLSTGGKKANDLVGYASLPAALILPLVAGSPYVWDPMGRNDLATGGSTVASIQADLISLWQMYAATGAKIIKPTITVRTQSTDLFETLGNQSPHALSNESVRVGLNQWLRDGAPMIGTSPQAVGATGPTVSRCDVYDFTGVQVKWASGPAGHLLKATVDLATTVESALDSGKWKAAKWVGTGDTHSNTTVDNITTVSGSIDQYDQVISTAGGIATGRYITTTLSGGAFTLNGAATATNAASRIICAYTDDGLHPNRIGHIPMAALTALVVPKILAS